MKLTLPLQRDNPARKPPGLAYDCELAARVRDGDRDALKLLVDRHMGRVQTYLLHRLGTGHDAMIEKVVAATFTDAMRRLRPYARGTASTPMEMWLIRLAERRLVQARPAAPPPVKVDKATDPPSDLTRLRSAISSLRPRHGFVLALAVYEQMPPADIAATLGVTPTAAMRRLRAALMRVARVLQQQEEDD
jgi:DNA-directed RNA polymerase specialized sigma24 family protein